MGISRKVSRKKTEAMLKLKQHMSNKASSVENISQETIDKSFDFLSKRYKLKLEQKMSKMPKVINNIDEQRNAYMNVSILREARLEAGYQFAKDFAKELNIAEPTYRAYERGENIPPLVVSLKLPKH